MTNQQEFAFMADAPVDLPNVWDRLLGGGEWLRLAELRAAGEAEFAGRVDASRGEVDEEYWREVLAAAHCFGVDTASSVVTFVGRQRRVHLVTAQLGDLLGQLLLFENTMALRWGAARDGWPSIVDELLEVEGCTALQAVVWDHARGEQLVAWEDGALAQGSGQAIKRDIIPDFESAVQTLGKILDPRS